ncbi:MAG: ubiquinol-cytochrome c reductase iron-sulfur subunit [Nitrospirae bacterium]|nr:ubiquinol-cytochrome c reductase iron-sulfur subunit [Nitrospirota bacterium]
MKHAAPQAEITEQTETSRRSFLKWLIGVLYAVNALVIGVPFLRTVIRAAPPQRSDWVRVAEINSLPVGIPRNINFLTRTEDAYIIGQSVRSVWIIKHSQNKVTVFSPICTHLGCHYTWKDEAGVFACPCHASAFSIDGSIIAGPAPRPLDTLGHKVENGAVYVQWEQFKVGTTQKVRV